MPQDDNKVEMGILCKWNDTDFRSNRLKGEKKSAPKFLPFVPENFGLIHAYYLHFNRLDQNFWQHGKGPRTLELAISLF